MTHQYLTASSKAESNLIQLNRAVKMDKSGSQELHAQLIRHLE